MARTGVITATITTFMAPHGMAAALADAAHMVLGPVWAAGWGTHRTAGPVGLHLVGTGLAIGVAGQISAGVKDVPAGMMARRTAIEMAVAVARAANVVAHGTTLRGVIGTTKTVERSQRRRRTKPKRSRRRNRTTSPHRTIN